MNNEFQLLFQDGVNQFNDDNIYQAISTFKLVLECNPNAKDALYALARSYLEIQDFKNAKKYYRLTLAKFDDNYQSAFDLSSILLLEEKFISGFTLYENRIKLPSYIKPCTLTYPTHNLNISSKKILIYSEQGYGDTIQFCRFLSFFGKSTNINMIIQEPLKRLLEYNFPKIKFISHENFDCSEFKYIFSILSIPYITKIKTIPKIKKYLHAKDKNILNINKIKIGICWQGEKQNSRDKYRSINFEIFSNILNLVNSKIIFYSLQKDIVISHPNLINLGQNFNDFMDTANYISALDIVITVDTSIAHLSGALGIKTFLLIPYLPDWRWGKKSTTTKWYPSITIFRQSAKYDWDLPILQIKQTLSKTYALKNIDVKNEILTAIETNRQGQYKKALKMFQILIDLSPTFYELYLGLGLSYLNLQKYDLALNAFEYCTEHNPNLYEAYYNIGNIYRSKRQTELAISYYNKALELKNDFIECLNNLANCYQLMEKFEIANFFYQKALNINSNIPILLDNYASLLKDTKEFEKAEITYQKALEIDSTNENIHCNYGLLLILQGKYLDGWKHYEYRLKRDDFKKFNDKYINIWNGNTNLNSKILLIVCEQGFGDNIQFIRFVNVIQQRYNNCKINIITFKPLKKLFKTVKAINQVYDFNDELKNYDYYIPIMSFPYILQLTLQTIPSYTDIFQIKNEKFSYLKDNANFKIGFVWAGSKTHNSNANRDISLSHFLPIFTMPKCTFYSLQVGNESNKLKMLSDSSIINLGEKFNNFYDTASAILYMDLVITIDTSVSHLAGSLGIQTFVLIPSRPGFLWMSDVNFSHWYQNMKLFRNDGNNWNKVIEEVKSEVARASQPLINAS